MARPRRRQACTPALLEDLRYRYEETDESMIDIAATVARSHTYLRGLAREHGWTRYAPPPLDLSPAAKLAAEVAQLAEEGAAAAGRLALSSRATECNEGGPGPIRRGDHETPGRMGPRLRGDDEEESAPSPEGGGDAATEADLSNLAPGARLARLSEMARGLDFQLALLRRRQTQPQLNEDRRAVNAEFNHLVATAAIIENKLHDLQNGRSTPLPTETHDDTPEDIDAFRLRLAAKIEEFLQRRPDIGDGDADPGQGRDQARP
jgi:hypothetical protein